MFSKACDDTLKCLALSTTQDIKFTIIGQRRNWKIFNMRSWNERVWMCQQWVAVCVYVWRTVGYRHFSAAATLSFAQRSGYPAKWLQQISKHWRLLRSCSTARSPPHLTYKYTTTLTAEGRSVLSVAVKSCSKTWPNECGLFRRSNLYILYVTFVAWI